MPSHSLAESSGFPSLRKGAEAGRSEIKCWKISSCACHDETLLTLGARTTHAASMLRLLDPLTRAAALLYYCLYFVFRPGA
jgi:hypothetical protein